MWQKKIHKNCQILKLQSENETKNKNLSMQIVIVQYWCLFQDENSDITSLNSCVFFLVGIDLVNLSNAYVWCSNCKSVDSIKVGKDHNIEETLSQELFDR
jgi:hypothetical protein